jgi:hypothetical protein
MSFVHYMISGMSHTIWVQLFYGSGEIRYGPEGVDLSLFKTVVRDLTKSWRKTLGGHNQLALQGIQERWRAMKTADDGSVQQKWTSVLGAYAVRRYWKLEALCQECMHNWCSCGFACLFFLDCCLSSLMVVPSPQSPTPSRYYSLRPDLIFV